MRRGLEVRDRRDMNGSGIYFRMRYSVTRHTSGFSGAGELRWGEDVRTRVALLVSNDIPNGLGEMDCSYRSVQIVQIDGRERNRESEK